MATKYNQKQGLKRFTTPKRYGACKQAKKIIHIEETSPSPSLREDSYDRRSSSLASEGEEEELVPKERSTYDHLLRTLGSCSQSLANIYKRRQREEKGKSESESEEDDGNELEDDVDGGSESCSISEEENDYEDGNNHAMESKLHDLGMLGDVEPNEDAESKDDKEAFDTDQEQDFIVNGQSAIDAQDGTSSFYDHLEHKLLEGEVDNLTKRKCKYRWEKPAHFMSNCKWMGAGDCFLKDDNCDSDYGLKPKLSKHWLDVYEKSGGKDFHSSKQRLFFSLCNSYRDILHYNKKPFYLKGLEEDSSIMDAYIIHSLNHVFKTRDLVIKNDAKLAKQQDISKGDILAGEDFLDHGFTRPKVLILLPFASFALRVVKRLIQLTPSSYKTNVEYMDRFCDEFGTERAEDSGDHHVFEKQSSKPSDFQALFGGNNNDHFMIGIKFTRRCIKLYSDFYSSDMIIASPLGLVTKIGEAEKEKEKDTDYLSSIEVLIIDHADVIAMQNWSHVITAVEQLNRLPSKQHGTNVMRIRQWYLDDQAQFYRQSIILGFYLNPDINSFFNRHCLNFHGKVKLICEYKGVLPKVLLQVRQIYERFDVDSIENSDDARLKYFSKKVFPKIKDSIEGGIMLFISSYFEYVRLRNFLKSQNASFCLLGDYTEQSDISRARVSFFEGRQKIMLYTERAHFYHRYKIRGIQNLIIYSLPERKEFYPEIVNMLEGSHSMTCTALFSRFDQFRLERIVGTTPAKRMVSSEKGVFVFC